MIKKIILICICLFLAGCAEEERMVCEGTLLKVEYLQESWGGQSKTILHFTDKTTYVLLGMHHIPYKNIVVHKEIRWSGDWTYSLREGKTK